MKQYEFTKAGAEQMFDAVCNESLDLINHGTISAKLASRCDDATQDDLASVLDSINEHISIKITVGSHTITVPNNADFVTAIFQAIDWCVEN